MSDQDDKGGSMALGGSRLAETQYYEPAWVTARDAAFSAFCTAKDIPEDHGDLRYSGAWDAFRTGWEVHVEYARAELAEAVEALRDAQEALEATDRYWRACYAIWKENDGRLTDEHGNAIIPVGEYTEPLDDLGDEAARLILDCNPKLRAFLARHDKEERDGA